MIAITTTTKQLKPKQKMPGGPAAGHLIFHFNPEVDPARTARNATTRRIVKGKTGAELTHQSRVQFRRSAMTAEYCESGNDAPSAAAPLSVPRSVRPGTLHECDRCQAA